MLDDRLLLNPIFRQGLLYGMTSGAVGTIFTLASILIRFDRWVWFRLFDLNGICMFACCLIKAVVVAQQTGKVSLRSWQASSQVLSVA